MAAMLNPAVSVESILTLTNRQNICPRIVREIMTIKKRRYPAAYLRCVIKETSHK
jgi:hypothetical protein